jgi:hypothetical protein
MFHLSVNAIVNVQTSPAAGAPKDKLERWPIPKAGAT